MRSHSSGLPQRIQSSLKSNDYVNVFTGQHTSYTNVGWAPGTATLSDPGDAAFRFDPLRYNSWIVGKPEVMARVTSGRPVTWPRSAPALQNCHFGDGAAGAAAIRTGVRSEGRE